MRANPGLSAGVIPKSSLGTLPLETPTRRRFTLEEQFRTVSIAVRPVEVTAGRCTAGIGAADDAFANILPLRSKLAAGKGTAELSVLRGIRSGDNGEGEGKRNRESHENHDIETSFLVRPPCERESGRATGLGPTK
mmetsp:Transcript_35373/g.105669  ORF Transcript_35373/g.105669 Transcript_35373/m.105669 type:complete len:136 (+) Transcript_35373:851-1258(+)